MLPDPTRMADVLSATSLIVAVLAAFLTMWQAEFASVLDARAERDPANRTPQRLKADDALRKVLPLVGIAWTTALVLAPRLLLVGVRCGRCAVATDPNSDCAYDDVATMFVVVFTVLLGLAAVLTSQWRSLRAKRRTLDL